MRPPRVWRMLKLDEPEPVFSPPVGIVLTTNASLLPMRSASKIASSWT